jgi:polar amino acid transport system permease protein
LVQILFIYFGAAYLEIDAVTVFIAVLLALTLYQGAYVSEIFRAGLESVPAGQWEAGRTLGLPRWRILKDVVLPQTVTVVLPPLFGQYIGLVKNTSLASVIGYADLTRQGQGIIDRFGNPFLVFLVVAVGYFIISYPLSLTARSLEKRRIRKMATVS